MDAGHSTTPTSVPAGKCLPSTVTACVSASPVDGVTVIFGNFNGPGTNEIGTDAASMVAGVNSVTPKPTVRISHCTAAQSTTRPGKNRARATGTTTDKDPSSPTWACTDKLQNARSGPAFFVLHSATA